MLSGKNDAALIELVCVVRGEGALCTLTLTFWSKPSIWLSSSMRMRCTSLCMKTPMSEKFSARHTAPWPQTGTMALD